MAGGGAERERESVGFDSSIEYKQTEEPKIKDIKTRIGLKLCMITIIGLVALGAVVVIAYFLITWSSVRSFDQTATAELIKSYNEARSAIADDILKIGEQFFGEAGAGHNAASGIHVRVQNGEGRGRGLVHA